MLCTCHYITSKTSVLKLARTNLCSYLLYSQNTFTLFRKMYNRKIDKHDIVNLHACKLIYIGIQNKSSLNHIFFSFWILLSVFWSVICMVFFVPFGILSSVCLVTNSFTAWIHRFLRIRYPWIQWEHRRTRLLWHSHTLHSHHLFLFHQMCNH